MELQGPKDEPVAGLTSEGIEGILKDNIGPIAVVAEIWLKQGRQVSRQNCDRWVNGKGFAI